MTTFPLRFLAALTLSAALPTIAHAQSQTFTYSYNGNPIVIPIDSADVAAVAEIFVPAPIRIERVTVQVIVDYPAVGDLEVALFSARGTRTVLLDNDCGSLANINTTFADSAATEFEDFCPAEAGRGPFRGEQPLANSNGELASGFWSLSVQNTESDSRTGVIRAFTINITGTQVTQPSFSADLVANAAREDGGVIAPGELISIYGVALGPVQPVRATSTPLPNTLGGTTVTINGNPVPILYSSSLRVDVQAPFSLTPGTVANIQVQAPGGNSVNIPIEVVSAFPGLFTNQTNGRGQVAALNQDGSVNSVSNPASRGSVVSLFATGLGTVTPSVPAGTRAPSSPLAMLSDLAVIIGGVSAPVFYAGLAPGLIATYQVNVQVPNVVPGARSVVLLPLRGFASQPRAWIWVQ